MKFSGKDKEFNSETIENLTFSAPSSTQKRCHLSHFVYVYQTGFAGIRVESLERISGYSGLLSNFRVICANLVR
jgi:hypothetical protein